MVDFITVDYESAHMWQKKRRRKLPEVVRNRPDYSRRSWWQYQPNVLLLKEPLFRLNYWELVPNSSPVREAENYASEVQDPAQLEILSPVSQLTYTPEIENVPTLHALANEFPLKRW